MMVRCSAVLIWRLKCETNAFSSSLTYVWFTCILPTRLNVEVISFITRLLIAVCSFMLYEVAREYNKICQSYVAQITKQQEAVTNAAVGC